MDGAWSMIFGEAAEEAFSVGEETPGTCYTNGVILPLGFLESVIFGREFSLLSSGCCS